MEQDFGKWRGRSQCAKRYVGGSFGLPETEGFLPIQFLEKNKEMILFDLQTVAFGVLKNATFIADTLTIKATFLLNRCGPPAGVS